MGSDVACKLLVRLDTRHPDGEACPRPVWRARLVLVRPQLTFLTSLQAGTATSHTQLDLTTPSQEPEPDQRAETSRPDPATQQYSGGHCTNTTPDINIIL